jgi:dolichol-phosphate mannosyltransferase
MEAAQARRIVQSYASGPGCRSVFVKFSIVIPTYNEAAGIERLIESVSDIFRANGLDGELVVVDDHSPDGTGAIVDALADRYPVRCLHRPGKMGLSSGVIDGWKFARPESEALGAMDADFSHDATIVPKMVEALASGRYGLAIGSRYVKGGGIENWPKRRIFTSWVACRLAYLLTPIHDITSGFFLVKRDALVGVKLDPIGFKIGLEVAAKAKYGKALEIPYVFKDRVYGESKLNGKEITNYLKQLRRLYASRFLGKPAVGIAIEENVPMGSPAIAGGSAVGD